MGSAAPWGGVPTAPPPPARPSRLRGALVAALVLVAVAVAGVAAGAMLTGGGDDEAVPTTVPVTESSTTAPPTTVASTDELSDAEVVERHAAAVWKVEVEGCLNEGFGSSFAIDEHHLVTNAHVVSVDPTPRLVAWDGRTLDGTVVGISDELDVAVVEVDEALSQTLEWASPAGLDEGQRVVGLGFPIPGDFAATPGSIISFETEGPTRVGVRTDAALDSGNSGGPLLTTDGRVAGVVTYLDLRGHQNVAVALTRDLLAGVVDAMVQSPSAVERSCDFEPPSDIPDFVEPAPPPVTTLPPPTTSPPPTTAPCPTGRPKVTVDSVDDVAVEPDYLQGYWDVTVTGTVRNDTSATITLWSVDVTLGAVPGTHYGLTDAWELRSGQTTRFTADIYLSSPSRPDGANATLSDWDWADYEHYGCGTA